MPLTPVRTLGQFKRATEAVDFRICDFPSLRNIERTYFIGVHWTYTGSRIDRFVECLCVQARFTSTRRVENERLLFLEPTRLLESVSS